jgi:hypothetical protein
MSYLQNINHYSKSADFVFKEIKAANMIYESMAPEKEVIV